LHLLIYCELALSLVDVRLPTHPLTPSIFISCVALEISEWSVNGLIAGGTEYPRNLVRINFFFLNNDSDIMLEVEFKPNSTS